MRIDKDGKLDMFGCMDIKILEEFGWNVEDMAINIRELREELEKKNKELEQANNTINNHK